MGGLMKLACVAVLCMALVGAPAKVEGVSCAQVIQNLTPCLNYLMQGGSPTQNCCSGVKSILGAAGTTADKQTVCNCLKDAANRFPINDNNAQALPGLCGVSVPYKISRSTNCAA
uniref:Non-specific lipid-transfer protein n=2 Tax=Cajanus cajan TaxID=3821 RepID=A0A151S2N5_CAJCA|nr:Non-specific lipid-transfer protein 3 [Cajanus cajan]